MTVKTKENSIRYSNVFLMNTRASLLATVSHHIMHYSIIFWIRGLSCNLCFQRISETEYIKDKNRPFSTRRNFHAERHFLLFKDQLVESGRQKTKENIIPHGNFRLVENSPNKHFIPQFAELQYCNDGQKKHYDVNAKCAADTCSKFLL